MILECPECAHKTILLAKEEQAIRAELRNARRGAVKTIECRCGRMQFIIEARRLVGWGKACAA